MAICSAKREFHFNFNFKEGTYKLTLFKFKYLPLILS